MVLCSGATLPVNIIKTELFYAMTEIDITEISIDKNPKHYA
ncbi:hypothetical protein BACPLE_03385 [Phocaeicola plebeius DSM 17135]|uniref:Uncharacterized protein n=1 Tax=Phocaeicola plebeius (strain DSM 17135 / JCM 12973 / CCUG 54634 / M2) TaxID=484018 RepID=B5D2Z5_PHOPM|nr:hypothetical protein BACPLE_03385 [Phocaeicola plebeius DSM 17135]